MRLPILLEMPSSYGDRYDAQLRSAGSDPNHPIVIDDKSDVRRSAPTASNLHQARKLALSSQQGQIKTTRRKNTFRRQKSSSSSHSQTERSPDVFYPDLSSKIPQAAEDVSNATQLQEHLDHQLAQRLQKEEDSDPTISPSQKDLAQPNPYATLAGKRVSVATAECPACGNSSLIARWPLLSSCKHLPGICSTCYARWIAVQLEGSNWIEARCPESACYVKMTYNEIEQNAPAEIFRKYDTFIARAALNEDPDFRWCRRCESGQKHYDGNIFTCASCHHRICTTHEVTWHEGETCKEYDDRLGRQAQDQRAQEAASIAAIEKLSKRCPNCACNIEKNGGCDHMTCERCNFEFCWLCLCDYNDVRRQDNSAHAENCEYYA